jgi:N-acetyl-anhydromuramyl-L-alanine amidase AmpD
MKIIEETYEWAYPLTLRRLTDCIVLHHEAASGFTAQQIHQAHLMRGWSGIAYHYYVRKDGSVYRGRPENKIGAHTENENYHTIGICFEGNFETETMGEVQLEAGRALLADIKTRYPGIDVKRHKDFSATAVEETTEETTTTEELTTEEAEAAYQEGVDSTNE